jgi:hypothetical protein
MTETLLEFCDSRGVPVRVDRGAGVIRGVKILGLHSRNGREYLVETLRKAAALYEGAKVNVNHPKGSPAAPRDYQDRIGIVRGVELRPGEGLFGDLHFNPKHALAEQLIWDAEHAPENVGFSHNVHARTLPKSGGTGVIVEEITRVESVDLVADPATTRGLYEGRGSGIGGQRSETREAEAGAEGKDLELARLREQLREAEAARDGALLEQAISEELVVAGMPAALVTELFRSQLRAAGSADVRRQLIAERLQLARAASGARPLSREQHLAESALLGRLPGDAKSFAELITA